MKILAAVDFSTASETVLKVTGNYAKQMQAEVCLIHVEPPESWRLPAANPAHDMKTEHTRLQKDARALEKTGLKVAPLLLQDPSGETIVAEAERLGADLIIIGSHGHGALHKMLVGSTSESVLRKAKIPVMVIPAKG